MKDQIEEYLLSKNFEKDENTYTRVIKKAVGEVIVNGERKVQYQNIKISFVYIGEGWEGNSETDNNALTQWSYQINDEEVVQFLVHDLEDFKNNMKLK